MHVSFLETLPNPLPKIRGFLNVTASSGLDLPLRLVGDIVFGEVGVVGVIDCLIFSVVNGVEFVAGGDGSGVGFFIAEFTARTTGGSCQLTLFNRVADGVLGGIGV